jgi:hypothetical protein
LGIEKPIIQVIETLLGDTTNGVVQILLSLHGTQSRCAILTTTGRDACVAESQQRIELALVKTLKLSGLPESILIPGIPRPQEILG